MRIRSLARAYAGTSALLGVLTAVACLLVAGLPRTTQAAYDEALRRSLTSAAATQTDLTVTGEPAGSGGELRERARFDALAARWRRLLPDALRPLAGSGGHMSAKTFRTPVNGVTGAGHFLNLGWLSDARRRVDWARGREPGRPSTLRHLGATIPLIEVGVVDEAVRGMGLDVGQVKVLGESNPVAVRITGVFTARDPRDRAWSHDSDVLHVTRVVSPTGAEEFHTTSLMSDDGLAALDGKGRELTYRWVLPVDGRAASAGDAPAAAAAVAELHRRLVVQGTNTVNYRLVTGLPRLLGDFLAALSAARTVMYLVLGGLLAVALGVIALGVRLLTDRMEQPLALARARGGSLWQVAGAGAALAALATGPAALAGYALSFLVPGPAPPLAHLGPAVVAVTAVAFAAGRLALAHRRPLRERRDDVAAARPSARRLTLEALVVVVALGGAYLLRARGTAAAGGTASLPQAGLDAGLSRVGGAAGLDAGLSRVGGAAGLDAGLSPVVAGLDPYLLLIPVAVALAAALIVLRCYPYPLRLLVRPAARGRAAVPFLGLARAARARPAGALPVLVLLPALGVSVFAAVISDDLAAAQRLASWQEVGAPIRVTSDADIPAAAVERVRRTAGVERVALALAGRVQLQPTGEQPYAVAVDLAEWRRVAADGPLRLPAPLADGTALLSPGLAGGPPAFEMRWLSPVRLTARGVIGALPGFAMSGQFLLVPRTVLPWPAANMLLVKGEASPAELARLVPSATVRTQEQALAEIRADPLTGTVRSTLLVVTVALGAYALVAVVLALAAGAADRARAVSLLRTLGLPERQARWLAVLELLPLVAVTVPVGLTVGLALPAALGPGVDLSSYARGLPVGEQAPGLLTPLALAGGLAAGAVLGSFAHVALGRRRELGTVLRAGDRP
ncbi:FtsX-like permease family protein [Nonomuraea sp. NPDC050783]|uniref:FtsX-like permease family protein n=1 Tax=Nonomuraea sp. NPDC050783 TaxID=3154634 RepID=UPI003466011C